MGISSIGIWIAISLLLPNLLYIKFPPKNAPIGLKDAGIIFTTLERVGQAGCLILLVISKDSFQGTTINIWFVMILLCVAIYYFLWMRYLVKGQDFLFLYMPLGFIPIPMAIFPVFAFGFLAVWGESIWLGIAVTFLAIGHFVNSSHTYKSIR